MIKKSKLKDFSKEYSEIVLFSENDNYFTTFKPIIQELIKQEIKFSYISMDINDPGIIIASEYLKPYYIGSGFASLLFMNMLEAGTVLMTTPGLQTLTIKRSPGVKKYIHIVHSPIDFGKYRKYSFDHFDYIMCSGNHQIESIRILEKIRGSKEKVLLKTGCPYMDVLASNLENESKVIEKDGPKCVLIAPTWGVNGAFSKYGTNFLIDILENGFDVIVRPHPQMLVSEKKLLKDILNKTKKYSNIRWDYSPSGHDSLNSADIMISDLSGVIFDFGFIYQKPVISLSYDIEPKGMEFEDLTSKTIWELDVRKSLGTVVAQDKISNIIEVINRQLNDNNFKEDITKLREKSLFNFGNVGKIAVKQLLDIRGTL
ncbi:MAG: CDP-glycerol glycerophosphotransferase family protein [Spirochaetaceae bacterium]